MACLTDIRQQIIAGSPHLTTAMSGNTADSATICHIKTAAPAYIKRLVVNFAPFQSGSGTPSPSNIRAVSGYNSIDVTRCSAFEQYNGQTITVALPDTFYGGQLDILTGVLTVDCAVRTITGNDIGGSFYQRGDGNVRFTLSAKQPTADYGDGKDAAICASNMSVHPNGASSSTSRIPSIGIGAGNATPYVVLPASYGVTDLTSAAAWLNNNNFQFTYKMKYSETYQFTSQTLKTLRGINNIWSDQGTVEVTYWTY